MNIYFFIITPESNKHSDGYRGYSCPWSLPKHLLRRLLADARRYLKVPVPGQRIGSSDTPPVVPFNAEWKYLTLFNRLLLRFHWHSSVRFLLILSWLWQEATLIDSHRQEGGEGMQGGLPVHKGVPAAGGGKYNCIFVVSSPPPPQTINNIVPQFPAVILYLASLFFCHFLNPMLRYEKLYTGIRCKT